MQEQKSQRQTDGGAALARLAERGIDLDRIRSGAVGRGVLAEVVAGNTEEAVALVEMLGAWRDTESAALLRELEPHAPTKTVRRAIRRALYVLGQRGVSLPQAPPEPPPPPPLTIERAEPEAYVSHVDGRGDRLLWLLRRLPHGPTLLVSAHVNEPDGLLELTVGETTRKALRSVMREFEERHRIPMVPADWRAVDACLVEAHQRAAEAGKAHKGDYLRVRPRITTDPPAPPGPLVGDRLDPVDAALAGDSARLAEEVEMATWYPTRERLSPYLEELREVRESPLVLSPAQREDRVAGVLARAARELYPPVPWVRRLEEQAYFFFATRRELQARMALATARALASAAANAPPLPLFAAMVSRSMAALASAEAAREEEETRGSLIIRPSAFRAPPPGHPGRRRG